MNKYFAVMMILGASVASAATDQFQMYRTPNAAVEPFCNVYTSLTLTAPGANADAEAILARRLQGTCEIHVEPNLRAYDLTLVSNSCGSKYYEGSVGTAKIKVIDHRTRLCRDLVPAKIIMTETDTQGNTTTLYSKDREVTEKTVKISGTAGRKFLNALAAAGVENGNAGLGSAEYSAVAVECQAPVVLNPKPTCTVDLDEDELLTVEGQDAESLFTIIKSKGGLVRPDVIGIAKAKATDVECRGPVRPDAPATCTFKVSIVK